MTASELAIGWIKAWIDMDIDWLETHLTDDFEHISPFGKFTDKQNYLETIIPLAKKSVARLEIIDCIGEQNQAVIRFINHTPSGPVETCDWVTVKGDAICAIRSIYDTQKVRQVLSEQEQQSLDQQ